MIRDVGLDLLSDRKRYELQRRPTGEVLLKLHEMDELYNLNDFGNSMFCLEKRADGTCSFIDVEAGACSCCFFMKHAFCKHILYIHKTLNTSSEFIITDRRFRYRGNVKQAKRARGRTAHANPALDRN